MFLLKAAMQNSRVPGAGCCLTRGCGRAAEPPHRFCCSGCRHSGGGEHSTRCDRALVDPRAVRVCRRPGCPLLVTGTHLYCCSGCRAGYGHAHSCPLRQLDCRRMQEEENRRQLRARPEEQPRQQQQRQQDETNAAKDGKDPDGRGGSWLDDMD